MQKVETAVGSKLMLVSLAHISALILSFETRERADRALVSTRFTGAEKPASEKRGAAGPWPGATS
ncbi:hypothetical protein CGL52_11270 [Pyrobaculum aerophilum]|uniref:Uncharacterized protein n=1 Tax=Pyrobaculum aerophilum TaxID=13773 RepID=A0A371QZF0_9CREN|nr:hypothetical protein CGL52_11270 [Pyrobaculum aerophilum]